MEYLERLRWPDGFVCPRSGRVRAGAPARGCSCVLRAGGHDLQRPGDPGC
ncbi:hypothetical protein E1212_00680 [Jiangella ureilytica]|uniref:Transposase zinc-ribbon domain-containing protein n=1 Tax=Jiangella ureilytica TaxID=2530374 RepID=A0A4R4S654_9ACTN|nr:hypothetical protein E1212_00680 [Jiangella ureilytica]